MLNGEAGFGDSYGDRDFPFFRNFYAGGVNSVRGYEQSAIGPREYDRFNDDDFPTGGTKRLLGNAELFFPVPGVKDSSQFRLSAFLDAGSVWDNQATSSATINSCDGAMDCMRYSTGVGVSWFSPFGPIKLVLAKALNAEDDDRTEVLQFQFGSQF